MSSNLSVLAHIPLGQFESDGEDLLTVDEITRQLEALKIDFRNKVSELGERCAKPIEISINARAHNNRFYKKMHLAYPFDLVVTETEQPQHHHPFILGGK